jgi:hypothetical protein
VAVWIRKREFEPQFPVRHANFPPVEAAKGFRRRNGKYGSHNDRIVCDPAYYVPELFPIPNGVFLDCITHLVDKADVPEEQCGVFGVMSMECRNVPCIETIIVMKKQYVRRPA